MSGERLVSEHERKHEYVLFMQTEPSADFHYLARCCCGMRAGSECYQLLKDEMDDHVVAENDDDDGA